MTYLVGGSVAIAKTGAISASGAAGRLFNKFKKTSENNADNFIKRGRVPTNSVAYRFLDAMGNLANDIALWLDSEINLTVGSAATVGNATVNCAIYTSSPGEFITMQAFAEGSQSGGNNRQAISKVATFKNLGAGAVLVGSVTTIWQHKDTPATNLNLAISGDDLIWTVSGAAGQTINWSVRVNRA